MLTRSFSRFSCGFRAASRSLLLAGALVGVANSAEQDNLVCVGCHTTQGLAMTLPSSENVPLEIDTQALKASVHGAQPCTACHSGMQKFPHPRNTANNYREFQVASSQQCETCHKEQSKLELDSIHGRALAAGNRNAAVCTDCHGSHAIGKPNYPRHTMPARCGNCHAGIYEEYASSAHGKSLLDVDNPDVPTCTDCHEAHRQVDPTTQAFRLKSPKLCAKCHADEKRMGKYNISTAVFDTYVADFHGLTVTLFAKQHPDQRVNTAVCTDCHGIHNIQKTTDANSAVIKKNLLTACRRCHPDATANFPDSWVGHFPPTRDSYPLVYWVNLFYRFLIPITIGGMVLFVLIDAGGRIIRRFR